MDDKQGWAGKMFYPHFSNNGMGKTRQSFWVKQHGGKTKIWRMWTPYWVIKHCFLNFPSIFVLLWQRCLCKKHLLLNLIVISHCILSLTTVKCNAGIFYVRASFVIQNLKLDIDACSLLWKLNKLQFCLYFSVDIETLLLMKCVNRGRNIIKQILNNIKLEWKQISWCCIYDEDLLAENMKDYFVHVRRTTTDVVTTKGKNSLSLVKGHIRIWSFVSLLMLHKF